MSVDVEEWYQCEFVRKDLRVKPFTNVEQSLIEIIDLFDTYNTKATFFMVGETLLRYPKCGELILEAGHELGFHGWDHRPLWEMHPNEFARDLHKFQGLLDEWNYTSIAFRAPSASLDNRTSWALREIVDAGYLYDSSVFPCWTPLYGVLGAPIHPYWPSEEDVGIPASPPDSCGILEFPFLALGPSVFRIPLGTGFYLRSLPMALYKWALDKRNKQGVPAVVSFHSWEYSRDVPKIQTSMLKGRYLHHGLGNCKRRVESLLQGYSFTSMQEIAHRFRSSFNLP
jgi:polysaccharide deacetylase family protein (PEP-CTERM system associated)